MLQLIKRAVTRFFSPTVPACPPPTVTYIMETDLLAFCREVAAAIEQHEDDIDLVMLEEDINLFRRTYRADYKLLQKHLYPLECRIARLRAELESRKPVPSFRNR